MKKIILKLIGIGLVCFGILLLIGFVAQLSEGKPMDKGDWYLLVVTLIFPLGLGISLLRSSSIPIGEIMKAHSLKKSEKMVENISKLEEAIREFDAKYEGKKSANIFMGSTISSEILKGHIKKHASLASEEKPLFILNGVTSVYRKLFAFTGFVITDKNIYFATLKRSFFTGLFPFKEEPSSIPLEYVTGLQIGKHDACYGTAYVGHDLMINGQVLGLVRLGFGMFYDSEAGEYINALSQFLYENNFFTLQPSKISF